MNDSYNLERFVKAQEAEYESAREELRAGWKRGHWMWFIFPQIKGLGHSDLAREFAISSLQEANAYLKHSLLGPRLRECARLVTRVKNRSASEIFGPVDELKFRSSMTLFARAAPEDWTFSKALKKYFNGVPDALTLAILKNSPLPWGQ